MTFGFMFYVTKGTYTHSFPATIMCLMLVNQTCLKFSADTFSPLASHL